MLIRLVARHFGFSLVRKIIWPCPQIRDTRMRVKESHAWSLYMSLTLKIVLIAVALTGIPVGYTFYQAHLSPDNWVYEGSRLDNWKIHGTPGPIIGAGLPVIAIGYGAFLLFRR